MALCNDQKIIERAAEALRRDRLFNRLHEAHAMSWTRAPTSFNREDYRQFNAWKMAWWRELERAFPDKIKNGVAVCARANTRDHGAPSTYLSVSRSPRSDNSLAVCPSSNGLYPEAIPYMQQPVDPGTFPEVMKSSGLICSPRSKPISKASEPHGK